MVAGGVNSMTISCGHSGLASCHCVCQNVFGSPSTAFAPLPSSPAVSSLSTLTSLSATLDAEGAAGGAADTTSGAVLLVVAVWLAQPAERNRQTARADAPANRRFIFVFMALDLSWNLSRRKSFIRLPAHSPANAFAYLRLSCASTLAW